MQKEGTQGAYSATFRTGGEIYVRRGEFEDVAALGKDGCAAVLGEGFVVGEGGGGRGKYEV